MFVDNGESSAPGEAGDISTSSPGAGQDLFVSKAAVLRVRAAFLDASERLNIAARTARGELTVAPPGGDDTSSDLAEYLNRLFARDQDSYVERVHQIAAAYEAAAENCAAIALQYGYTEEQVTASFTSTLPDDA